MSVIFFNTTKSYFIAHDYKIKTYIWNGAFLSPRDTLSQIWFYNNQHIKFVDPEFPGYFNTKVYSVLANTSTSGKYASDYPISANNACILAVMIHFYAKRSEPIAINWTKKHTLRYYWRFPILPDLSIEPRISYSSTTRPFFSKRTSKLPYTYM